jgi:sugar phosphate isomerase/epimerase
MQIGISTIWKTFQKEHEVLNPIVDFYEVILSGDSSELSSYAGSEDRIRAAHLPGLDQDCFSALDVAECLKIEKAVVHFHTVSSMDYDAKIETLRRLLKGASKFGITLCLENTEESPEIFMDIFKRLPELGFCLDVGHANLFSNDPQKFLAVFSDRLKHIHVHSNHGGDSEKDDIHLPVGEGNIDYHQIFSKLSEIGYNDTMTLELHPRFNTEKKFDSLNHLRSIVDG